MDRGFRSRGQRQGLPLDARHVAAQPPGQATTCEKPRLVVDKKVVLAQQVFLGTAAILGARKWQILNSTTRKDAGKASCRQEGTSQYRMVACDEQARSLQRRRKRATGRDGHAYCRMSDKRQLWVNLL